MRLSLSSLFALFAAVLALGTMALSAQNRQVGIVLLAHGGSASWNDTVSSLGRRVNERVPTEVAFGMATRATIQAAVDRLAARGVEEIVAMPLFISSHSSVIESTEYLLGTRAVAPADLAIFARMNHGAAPSAPDASNAHAGHQGRAMEDGTQRVTSPLPIHVGPALDDHPIVADILVTRARSISHDPAQLKGLDYAMAPQGLMPDDRMALWVLDAAVVK